MQFATCFRGREALNREHAGKTLRHLMRAGGIATGLTPGAVGNVVQFATDYMNRQARPKDVTDVFRGLREAQVPKERSR